MTTGKHVVADDILGRISRRIWELIRRVLEGSADHDRAQSLIQLAIEGIPEPHDEGSSWGTYILECRWWWDNMHVEFATIGLEKGDSDIPFEDLLNPAIPRERKAGLLDMLRRIYDAQVPKHGGRKMVRVYRVLRTQYIGYDTSYGEEGELEREAIDVHLILQPICDFDYKGDPEQCLIRRKDK